ncbi:hypothetical protein [Peribacillus butanolivorans]
MNGNSVLPFHTLVELTGALAESWAVFKAVFSYGTTSKSWGKNYYSYAKHVADKKA